MKSRLDALAGNESLFVLDASVVINLLATDRCGELLATLPGHFRSTSTTKGAASTCPEISMAAMELASMVIHSMPSRSVPERSATLGKYSLWLLPGVILIFLPASPEKSSIPELSSTNSECGEWV